MAYHVMGEGRAFPTADTLLMGARAGVSWIAPNRPSWRPRIDAGVLWGSSDDALGEVDMTLVSVGAGLGAVLLRRPASLELGPRMELGRGSVSGAASNVTTGVRAGSAWIWNAAAAGSVRWPISSGIGFRLDVDAGYTLHGMKVSADTRTPAAMSGVVFGLRLGFELTPALRGRSDSP
jgi:hypothetical protein